MVHLEKVVRATDILKMTLDFAVATLEISAEARFESVSKHPFASKRDNYDLILNITTSSHLDILVI